MAIVDVERLKRSGQKFVNGFTPGQKVISVLGVAGLVLATSMFMKWSSAPSYSPLFSNLSGKDAGDVTSALDSMGVKYKLTNGGGTVEVPQSQLYKARVDLSAKGLPANSDAWASFDKAGITTSAMQQDVNYQRALQAELQKTVEAINGVRGANVNLALPSDDPFVGDNAPKATAAVQVDTGGVQLGAEQVQSIVHLVSSSVKSLAPNDVTVTDTSGNLLYAPGADDAFASTQNLSKEMAFEAAKKAQIEDMLAKSLGPGHATVTVSANVDFSKGTTEQTQVTPVTDANGKLLPLNDNHEKTTFTGPGSNNTGILGPNGTPAGGTTPKQSYVDDKTNNTYGTNTQHTVTDQPGFNVKQLDVAVALDKSVVTQADVATYQNLVAAAAGIDTTNRKDVLTVQLVPMDKTAVALAKQHYDTLTKPPVAASPMDLMKIVRYVVTLLIVALVLLMARRSVKKAQLSFATSRVPLDLAALEAPGMAALPAPMGDAAHAAQPALAGARSGALPAAGSAPTATAVVDRPPLDTARSPVETEVVSLIERQPDEVAQTLRSWLADRRG